MAVFEKWFKQDLLEPIKIHSVGDLVFTEDNLSNVVGVELFRGGRSIEISGSVTCHVIRADGSTVISETGTISGNKVSITLPKAAMMIPGKVAVMLQLVTGDVKTTVLKAVFFSNLEMTDTIIDPEHIVPDISDVIAQMAAMEAATEAAQDAADELNSGMADIIKAQATQPVEELNKVWFDTNTETEVTVPEYSEFEPIKNSYMQVAGGILEANLVLHDEIIASKALLSDGTETTATVTCLTGYIPVIPGYTYSVSQSLGSSTYCNCFYDKNKVFLTSEYSRGTAPLMHAAPENAAYMRVTGLKASSDDLDVHAVLTSDSKGLHALDATLTVSGAAADSKVVGDKIDILNKSVNLFDHFNSETTTDGRAINYSNGTLNSVAVAFVSDYIPVIPGGKVYITQHLGSSTFGNFFYTADKQGVAKYYSNAQYCELTAPDNARFIRVNGIVASKSAMHVYVGANPINTYNTRHDRVSLKPLEALYGGYSYVGFSGGCMLGGNEVYVSRFSSQHATPTSRSDWGKIGFVTRNANGFFSDPVFPELDYANLQGELRDPNLVSAKNGYAFLSGFATNKESSTAAFYNYLYLINSNFGVIDKIFYSTDTLFWGNTLITPNGYLLHCGYTPSNNLRLLRSNNVFNGSALTGITFSTVHDFGNVANEATVGIWNDKLVVVARNSTWTGNAMIFVSDDLEGEGTFTQHMLTAPIHAPAIQPINRKRDLLVGGSKVLNTSTQQRAPIIAIVDSNYSLASSAIVEETTGTLNGYGSLLKLSNDEYGIMYFHDGGSNRTELNFKQVNVNYLLDTTYYEV